MISVVFYFMVFERNGEESIIRQQFLPTGKLPHPLLRKMLEQYTTQPKDVIVGASIGEDAAVIDFNDHYLLAKTDPITFTTEEIGYYAIHINANDIACMGGRPRWFLATILLPEGKTTETLISDIFSQLSEACGSLDIAFCGGHTEITSGVDRPVVVGHMLGDAPKNRLLKSSDAQIGDDIIMTKGIAIEATSIIAREKSEELAEIFSRNLVQQCKNYLRDPGISVLREAQIAMEFEDVHAMHDPTEGGLAAGLNELARAANMGIRIDLDMIDILPECKLLCDVYQLDPLGIIASGALLIACKPAISHQLLEKLEQSGINSCKIGKMMPLEYGMKAVSYDGETGDLPYFPQDEIVKLFRKEN